MSDVEAVSTVTEAWGAAGVVTDVQRFSLHDGPGIRTTVFFKGCHLRCAWCHNPETLAMAPGLLFYADKCLGCQACVAACPRGVHAFRAGKHELDRERCEALGECVMRCPAQALALTGRRVTVADVMAEVREDRAFYGAAGGVTLSGGEPVLQGEFAAGLLSACRADGIGAAIETSLCYPWGRLEPLLQWTDLVMFDVKLASPARHRQAVGASNRHVWENLPRLDATGLPLIARTPLIDGVNDDEDGMGQIADQLAQLRHLEYYELLPYHPLGVNKYQALGRPAPRFRPPAPARLARLARIAEQRGLKVLIEGKEPADAIPSAA
ncbi:MAG: glycyl-radical enzyme activating protein [Bifidobacteriaceae bacterium]|nr:glycyl-radical enzyme activating protein [Bifidobacteriaceae bacterium]